MAAYNWPTVEAQYSEAAEAGTVACRYAEHQAQ